MTTAVDATSTNSILQNYLTQQSQNIAADKTAAATAAASGANSSGSAGIGSNLNTFLKILTTQLQHQDPTSATDPNQFTQELVQFAGVEQQLTTNGSLKTLIGLQKTSSGVTAALGYMGQYVETTGTNGKLPLQNGTAEIGFTLPSPAQTSVVTVKDANGKTVAILQAPKTQGLNYLSWNGKDQSGNQLPDGAYSFTVAATDTNGKAETLSDVRVIGKVTGITSNSDGSSNLSLDAISTSTSTVDAVFSTGKLPSATGA